jgi:hypothetical protein
MSRFGITKSGLKILFEEPAPWLLESKVLQPNTSRKNMTHLGAAFFVTQLIPGKNLNDVQEIALSLMNEKLQWESMLKNPIYSTGANINQRRVSLLDWTSQTFVESTTIALFGPALLRIEPTLPSLFLQFDEKIWKLMYSVPSPWSNDMLAYKNKLHGALVKYLDLSKDQRTGASWFTRTFESEMRARGLGSHDIACCLAMVLWV